MPTTRLKSSTTRCRIATCRLRNAALGSSRALALDNIVDGYFKIDKFCVNSLKDDSEFFFIKDDYEDNDLDFMAVL